MSISEQTKQFEQVTAGLDRISDQDARSGFHYLIGALGQAAISPYREDGEVATWAKDLIEHVRRHITR